MSKIKSSERVSDSDLENESVAGSDGGQMLEASSQKRGPKPLLRKDAKRRKVKDDRASKNGAETGAPSQAAMSSFVAESPTSVKAHKRSVQDRQVSESLSASEQSSHGGSENDDGKGKGNDGDSGGGSEDESINGASSQASSTGSAGGSPTSTRPTSRASTPSANSSSHKASVLRDDSESIPYAPPHGFIIAPVSSLTEDVDQVLMPDDLDGKQLWHITAPASVPLSNITNIAFDEVKRGFPVLTYKGTDYGLVSEASGEAHAEAVLRASEESNVFQRLPRAFDQTFHLQQIINKKDLPSHDQIASNGAGVTASTHVPLSKEVVAQPAGLRARYWPPGFEPGLSTEFRGPQFADGEPRANGVSQNSITDGAGTIMVNSRSHETKEERRRRKEQRRIARLNAAG